MHQSNKRKNYLVFGATLVALFLVFVVSLNLGSAKINVFKLVQSLITNSEEVKSTHQYIFLNVRLPRIALCLLTGLCLGLSGCIMQNLLRNPLVSPFTLGVSSGASFGAALAIVLGGTLLQGQYMFFGYSTVGALAFMFGSLSLMIVVLVSRFAGDSITILILTGVAISSLFSAGVSILKYISAAETLKNLDIWLMGGFWASTWQSVITIFPFFLICFLFVFYHAWDYNALNAGEDIALSLGVSIKKIKYTSLILVTLITSLSIAFSGIIGFIGLMAPHISRSLIGNDNRLLIPQSTVIGALVLLMADTLARTIISPREIPVGIITALIGVPIFIVILIKRQREIGV